MPDNTFWWVLVGIAAIIATVAVVGILIGLWLLLRPILWWILQSIAGLIWLTFALGRFLTGEANVLALNRSQYWLLVRTNLNSMGGLTHWFGLPEAAIEPIRQEYDKRLLGRRTDLAIRVGVEMLALEDAVKLMADDYSEDNYRDYLEVKKDKEASGRSFLRAVYACRFLSFTADDRVENYLKTGSD